MGAGSNASGTGDYWSTTRDTAYTSTKADGRATHLRYPTPSDHGWPSGALGDVAFVYRGAEYTIDEFALEKGSKGDPAAIEQARLALENAVGVGTVGTPAETWLDTGPLR